MRASRRFHHGTASPPVDPGVSPTLNVRAVGISGAVKVNTTSATSVRLRRSTDAAGTANVVFSSAATPDAQGWATLTTTGMVAGTRYYYRIGMTNTQGTEYFDTHATVGRVQIPPTAATSFTFNAGSCTDATDSASMSSIAARNDDFFIHLGDMWYADGTGQTLANYRSKMREKQTATNHVSVFATTPTAYTPSDHDFGMANNVVGASNTTARDLFNQVYRESWPITPVPTTTGVYHTFTWGRVRFIILDTRSFCSAMTDPDSSTKTKLGATQKQWLKDTLNSSTSVLHVIVGDVPWTGPTATSGDGWDNYNTERQELGTFYTGTGKNICYVAGDMHAVAADDGTNTVGGINVFQCAPLNNAASIKQAPYSVGPYPASGTAVVQQYGHFAVTDTGGSTITLAWTGLSSDGTVRASLSKTYSTVVTPPPTVTNRLAGKNPSAELADISGWTTSNNTTLVRDGSQAPPKGSWAFKATVNNTTVMQIYSPPVPFDTPATTAWGAACQVRWVSGTPKTTRINIQWLDVNNIVIATGTGDNNTVFTDRWTYIDNQGEIPAAGITPVNIRVQVIALTPAAGDAFDFDMVQLEPAVAALPAYTE